jgi:hypothetical protein
MVAWRKLPTDLALNRAAFLQQSIMEDGNSYPRSVEGRLHDPGRAGMTCAFYNH